MLKKSSIIIISICFVIIFICKKEVCANPENIDLLELNSESAILIDADTKQILYAKNEHERLYPASITKIMTMLLALENGNLNDTLIMSYNSIYSIPRDSSHISLFENEEITLLDALNATSIASANDASNGIAEYISGTTTEFAELMTNKAKDLGALNTNFKNAHGLPDDNHYTTAYDMAMIMSYAIDVENYIEITSTLQYSINPTNIQTESRYLHNKNKTLNPESPYYVEEAITSKTGWTSAAQSTQVTYASKDELNLIAVVLKADSAELRYQDTKRLLEYGFENYEFFDACIMPLNLPNIQLSDALELQNDNQELLSVDEAFIDFIIEKGTSDQIEIVYDIPEIINKQYASNSNIGQVNLYYKEELVQSIDITVRQPILEKIEILNISDEYKKKVLIKIIFTLIISIFILLGIKKCYSYKRGK